MTFDINKYLDIIKKHKLSKHQRAIIELEIIDLDLTEIGKRLNYKRGRIYHMRAYKNYKECWNELRDELSRDNLAYILNKATTRVSQILENDEAEAAHWIKIWERALPKHTQKIEITKPEDLIDKLDVLLGSNTSEKTVSDDEQEEAEELDTDIEI